MRVAIVGGARTPFVKAAGVFSRYSALDLGKHTVSACLERGGIDPATVDEIFFGTVLLDPRFPNLAREIVLRTGLSKSITGHFIANNCITGLVAASAAHDAITNGRIRCALAGGSESMSRPALTFPGKGEEFFIKLSRLKTLADKLRLLSTFRPGFVVPQAPSPKEPSTGLTMGQHCEIMAKEFGITRREQDEIAFRSHKTAAAAQSAGFFERQIVPLGDVRADNLVRPDTSLEKLAALPPVFDKSAQGTISAGNSSALTDGASVVCLMAEDDAVKGKHEILGFLDGLHFASVPPGDGLLMAPALALPALMKRFSLTLDAIDVFEVHEAFGAQVACNMSAWEKGWKRYPQVEAIGAVPVEKMNLYGGSIAIGHPFAATGGRMILTACQALKDRGGKRAVISICAAGGGAGAALISAP